MAELTVERLQEDCAQLLKSRNKYLFCRIECKKYIGQCYKREAQKVREAVKNVLADFVR